MGLIFTKKDNVISSARIASDNGVKLPMIDQNFVSKTSCISYILEDDTDFIDIGTAESFDISQKLIPSILKRITVARSI